LAQFEPKQKGALLLRFFQNLALVRGTFWPKLVAHFEPFYPVLIYTFVLYKCIVQIPFNWWVFKIVCVSTKATKCSFTFFVFFLKFCQVFFVKNHTFKKIPFVV